MLRVWGLQGFRAVSGCSAFGVKGYDMISIFSTWETCIVACDLYLLEPAFSKEDDRPRAERLACSG